MATTPAQATSLQALAAAGGPDDAPEAGPALSLYVDLDPSSTPTIPDTASRLRAALDALGRLRPRGDHAALASFDAARERVEEALHDEGLRSGGPVHGLAVFARGGAGGVLEAWPLHRSMGDLVHAGRRFALRRLAVELARTQEVLLLEASRERGRVSLLRRGVLRELLDAEDEIENRHSAGGWAQDILQRHTDRDAELHLADVAERLERVHARLGRPPLVLAATAENAAVVEGRLSQEAAAALAGRLGEARDMAEPDLVAALQRTADELDARREAELLERRTVQLAKGVAEGSLEAVVASAQDARVTTLLLSRAADPAVWSCPQCGRLLAADGECPLDGTAVEPDPDGVEAVVGAVLAAGGDVWELLEPGRRDLDASGGLGAILRW